MITNKKYYIIYAIDSSSNVYYMLNTNPIAWSNVFIESKQYLSSKNAEYEILKDYDNYRQIKQMIDLQVISEIYIAEVENGNETRRARIL